MKDEDAVERLLKLIKKIGDAKARTDKSPIDRELRIRRMKDQLTRRSKASRNGTKS